MKFSYYPGCTLSAKAKDLDEYGRKAAEALGITLEELPEWQCCGAVYPNATDEIATRLSSVRALSNAKKAGMPLVTLCSACHHVIKRVNHDMLNNVDIREKVNTYLGTMEGTEPYEGDWQVIHYLEMLRDCVGFDELKAKVVNPLKGKKIGAYYGCLLLRPGKEMQMDDPENPTILEDFIRAIGAEPVYYGMRNECCGGYITVEDKAQAKKRVNAITDNARNSGAEMLITACPLCHYNLQKNADEPIQTVYFTELLAEALGVK